LNRLAGIFAERTWIERRVVGFVPCSPEFAESVHDSIPFSLGPKGHFSEPLRQLLVVVPVTILAWLAAK
jgi:hypothetical protein